MNPSPISAPHFGHLDGVFIKVGSNAKLSRSRWKLSTDETQDQQISWRLRKRKGQRLSALVKS